MKRFFCIVFAFGLIVLGNTVTHVSSADALDIRNPYRDRILKPVSPLEGPRVIDRTPIKITPACPAGCCPDTCDGCCQPAFPEGCTWRVPLQSHCCQFEGGGTWCAGSASM